MKRLFDSETEEWTDDAFKVAKVVRAFYKEFIMSEFKDFALRDIEYIFMQEIITCTSEEIIKRRLGPDIEIPGYDDGF